jgi:hypothetical protein
MGDNDDGDSNFENGTMTSPLRSTVLCAHFLQYLKTANAEHLLHFWLLVSVRVRARVCERKREIKKTEREKERESERARERERDERQRETRKTERQRGRKTKSQRVRESERQSESCEYVCAPNPPAYAH